MASVPRSETPSAVPPLTPARPVIWPPRVHRCLNPVLHRKKKVGINLYGPKVGLHGLLVTTRVVENIT